MTYTNEYLARHIAANPYNLARVAGFPPLCNHWINAARFQLEGRRAAIGQPCSYKAETMAALHWNKGQSND